MQSGNKSRLQAWINKLPIAADIFQEFLLNRIISYVNYNNIINEGQFGFRYKRGNFDGIAGVLDENRYF